MNELCQHDIEVRNSWVSLLSAKTSAQIKAINEQARFDLYREVDGRVKALYLKTITEANKDLEVVKVKGLGPTRRSKNMINLDQALAEAAVVVVAEMFGEKTQ